MPGASAAAADARARDAAEAVAQRSYTRLLALLAARTRDVAGAEDALSSAFAAALATWPEQGVPRSPEAWLLTVARRKEIDARRRRSQADEAAAGLRAHLEGQRAGVDGGSEPAGRCALTLVCAHPAVDPAVRAPLVLQALLGFHAAEIASAFRVRPATMSQRLVRAKRRMRAAGMHFEAPDEADLAERIAAVLTAVSDACAATARGPRVTASERPAALALRGRPAPRTRRRPCASGRGASTTGRSRRCAGRPSPSR